MSTSLQELLSMAGLSAGEEEARRRLRADLERQSQEGMRRLGYGGVQNAALGQEPQSPVSVDTEGKIPPLPTSAQPPPRPFPAIPATGDMNAPSTAMRTRYAGPDAAAQNQHLEDIQSFGGGEPFGSTRPRRAMPRDYVADDVAYARDLERQPHNKVLDVLTGVTQGLASLEGNQPKGPWGFSGRDRKLGEVYGRLGRELGVQKEQAQIKNLGTLGDYRSQQVFGSQQKRMIDLYKSLPKYTKGANPAIDQMFQAAGLEFEDKDPKTAKPGARHYFRMNGQEMILDPGATEAYAATGAAGAELYDPTQQAVETVDPRTGQTLQVKPGTALTASATALSQGATQGRFDVEEFHRRQTEARTAADNWQKAWDEAQSLKAAVEALEAKRTANGGTLYGQDAVNMATWPKMAASANMRATSLMNEINTRHGDFYYIDQNGLTAKNPQPPSQQAAPGVVPSARPRVDHAKFEKMYAEAKTPEERARLMKLYQDAIKAAGQQ